MVKGESDEDTWNEEYMCRPSSEQSSLLGYSLIASCEVANLQLQDVLTPPPHTDSLRFANGSKIYAGSSNPKFLRGKGGDADADEYAFHAEQRQLFKAMHATAMVWGQQLRLWSTHNGEGSTFNAIVKDLKEYRSREEAIAGFDRAKAEAAANHLPPVEGERPAKWTGVKGDVQTVTILGIFDAGRHAVLQAHDAGRAPERQRPDELVADAAARTFAGKFALTSSISPRATW